MEMDKKSAVIAVSALIVGLSPFIIEFSSIDDFDVGYNATANVTNTTPTNSQTLGIVTGQNLEFGRLPVGTASVKYINISSSKPALMNIDASGNISEHLEFNRQTTFQGDERTSLRFNASEPGYYEGVVSMKIQTPKNQIGEIWLDLKSRL